MSMIPVPVIGSKGAFDFLPPFDTLTVKGVEYLCQGVRTISDYIANNEDPKAFVYDRYKLAETVYNEDKEKDAYIVSLQSAQGQWLYVPVRYIKTYPVGDGIRYTARMLNFSLPSIPVEMDLTELVDELKQRIKSRTGTDVKATIVQTSQVVLVSRERHEETEVRRLVNRNGSGLFERVVDLEAQLQAVMARNKALEDYIKLNPPPATP